LCKTALMNFILLIIAVKGFAATYDWVGTTATSGVYNWNNKLNWQVGGVAATTTPGAADIVQIAVNAYTNAPTITDAQSCASIIFGTYDNFTLTVNGTLTVSGGITQNNDPNFYQTTILAGTGTITCGSFTIGDLTTPGSGTGVVNNVSVQVNQMNVTGNITLRATGNSSGNGIVYPYFSLDANNLKLTGQIVTVSYNNPLSGGTGDPGFPGLGLFQMDTGTSPTALELLNINPISTPITNGFTIDFTNNGSGTGTVLYDATSGSQAIYTTGTSGLGINNYNYDCLTFGGASSKVVANSTLTIGGNWTSGGTGAVNLNTNNPAITVTGNWVNSVNVTQGSGNITVTGILQNNGNTITLGSGTLTVTNTMQINTGTVATGSGTVTVTGVYQNNSGTLTCGSGSVIFKGTYQNNGTFTAGAGTVYFSGTSQSLTDNSATGTIFKNVTFNCTGTATMGAGTGNFSVASTGVLTLVSPAKLVAGSAAAAYLTLKSDATGSATVAALTGTSTITGFVNVQRYVTGGSATYRGYRLLSSPVYVSTVSGNNVYSLNYLKNSCYLTGSGGTGGSFDKTGNPTLYLYRENLAPGNNSFTAGNFRGIANLASSPGYTLDNEVGTFNIPVGNGFLFFFRGNRSTSLASKTTSPYPTPENTTLTATGTLAQGQVVVHEWYTPALATIGYTTTAGNSTVRGFNLVGNPYASSVNWDLFNTTTTTSGIYGSSVGTTMYVLDPVSHNFGAYTKGSGGIGTHNASNVIPSGQGFFVVATAATGKLIFNESAKVATQVTGLNLLMGKPVNEYANLQYLHLVMIKDSVNTDDIIIHLKEGAMTTYDAENEALYRSGQGVVSLSSMSSDNYALAINVQPFPKETLAIPLSASASSSGYYHFNLKNIVGIPRLYNISLVDHLTKDSVDLRESSTYDFAIDKADSNSFGPNRFKLVISQNKGYAYHLVKFTATKNSEEISRQVNLSWQAKNEENYTRFTVERSIDNGATFEVLAWKTSNGHGNYASIDKSPQFGRNVYRLKTEDVNGAITYSALATIEYSTQSNTLTNSNINIYPNPAKGTINLTITEQAGIINKGNYKIKISNSTGLLVRNINLSQTNWQGSVNDLTTGTYVVQVWNTKDQTLVGQTKFVKL